MPVGVFVVPSALVVHTQGAGVGAGVFGMLLTGLDGAVGFGSHAPYIAWLSSTFIPVFFGIVFGAGVVVGVAVFVGVAVGVTVCVTGLAYWSTFT